MLTAAWAAPGFLCIGFYLLAPLVVIMLVSFWARTDSGFDRDWTLPTTAALPRQDVLGADALRRRSSPR